MTPGKPNTVAKRR